MSSASNHSEYSHFLSINQVSQSKFVGVPAVWPLGICTLVSSEANLITQCLCPCRYTYSEQAAAIMYVAMRAFNKQDSYPVPLMRHAFQTKESILHVAKEVVNLVTESRTNTLQAVVKKYSTTKFMEAAQVEPPLAILQES